MHNISSPPFSREPAPSSPALVILSQSLDFLQEHPPCNNRAPEHLLQGAIFGCAHPLEAFISKSAILDARAPHESGRRDLHPIKLHMHRQDVERGDRDAYLSFAQGKAPFSECIRLIAVDEKLQRGPLQIAVYSFTSFPIRILFEPPFAIRW
jgi:hypothetical protein